MSLDCINSIIFNETATSVTASQEDFFALAGLWENRDIDAATLCKQAWPELY